MRIHDWLPEQYHPRRTGEGRKPLIDEFVQPLRRFLHVEAASGVVLLACTVVALAVANSPWAGAFSAFWQTPVGLRVGGFVLEKPLLLWINDGLMTIFFFVVGLEIKRELVWGELRDPKMIALPAAAALGGMVLPAAVYLVILGGRPGDRGWGVPMATDIAFVVGFLALLGPRVPFALKILLLTLAIVDDIGAVLVIAVAYTEGVVPLYLGLGAAGLGLCYLLNLLGVRRVPVYVVIGAGIWLAVLKSGVHPTVAGVLLGLLTPASAWYDRESLDRVMAGVRERLREDREAPADAVDHHEEAVDLLVDSARETISPLDRLESGLHPWVAYVIMPVFALANAGVAVEWAGLGAPVALAVSAGLVVGKPLGVLVFSWAAVRLGLARLPEGVNWPVLAGAACLSGIGFTMSLFIAGLALDGELLDAGKVGTLTGSAVSAALGCGLLLAFLRRRSPGPDLEAEKLGQEISEART